MYPYCMCAFECVSVSKVKLHVSSPKVWVHCWQHCDMSREVSWHKADAYFTIPCNSRWCIISHLFFSFSLPSPLSTPTSGPTCPSASRPCSNRSRTPPTCTSPTCRCLWMSRSWRICWSPWVTSSPRGYWGMPTGSAEELASPGIQ